MSSLIFLDDGCGKNATLRYKKRRQKFAKRVGAPFLIVGLQHGPSGTHPWAHCHSPIFQEPLLLYLTGINQTETALFVDPINKTEILFLPEFSEHRAFWDGARLWSGDPQQDKLSKTQAGFSQLQPYEDYVQFVTDYCQQHRIKELGMLWHHSKRRRRTLQDSNYWCMRRVKRAFKSNSVRCTVRNVAVDQWQLRAESDDSDVKNMRTAQKKTKDAFLALLPRIKECNHEYEVAGLLQGELLQRSPYGLSFAPIVASGKNAKILHYITNHQKLDANGLLLLDFGLRWQLQQSDISRTVPANGKFNPLQALLYQIVLDTQIYVESQVSSGRTLVELNTLCWDYMTDLLEERFSAKGGKMVLDYKKYPHFVGHRIGTQVHDGDPFGDYRHHPLNPGTVISNEPGLYGQFNITIKGKRYREEIGIRIEDDLLVMEKGVVNLSKDIPKTIPALEKALNFRRARR